MHGILFIHLPSGRKLASVKPRIGKNAYGSECVTYEGIGTNKAWERTDSYGPKFVENIVQAVSRDILAYAMRTLSHYSIVAHVHDEVIIEAPVDADINEICRLMSRAPEWIPMLKLNADGYCTPYYKKA